MIMSVSFCVFLYCKATSFLFRTRTLFEWSSHSPQDWNNGTFWRDDVFRASHGLLQIFRPVRSTFLRQTHKRHEKGNSLVGKYSGLLNLGFQKQCKVWNSFFALLCVINQKFIKNTPCVPKTIVVVEEKRRLFFSKPLCRSELKGLYYAQNKCKAFGQ